MNEYHLYWFSGSGNSLLICKTIKEELIEKGFTVEMKPMDKNDPATIDTSMINGFVVPVYEQGLCPLVWNFLKGLPTSNKSPVFFVDTLMAYSGGVKGPVKKILKKKGYKPLGAIEIIMPNNYYKRADKKEKDQKKVEKGIIKAKKFTNNLINNKTKFRDIPVYSTLMGMPSNSKLVSRLMNKLVRVKLNEDLCDKCGICTMICPTGHIIVDQITKYPKTINSTPCIQCLRCMSFCHSEAIKVGNMKNLTYRAVSIKEMIKELKS